MRRPISRAASLIYGSSMPWKTLVTARSLAGMKGETVAAFYAQSWLLTHYLFSDDARTEKLQKYLRAYVVEGKSDWPAFVDAFGLGAAALIGLAAVGIWYKKPLVCAQQ